MDDLGHERAAPRHLMQGMSDRRSRHRRPHHRIRSPGEAIVRERGGCLLVITRARREHNGSARTGRGRLPARSADRAARTPPSPPRTRSALTLDASSSSADRRASIGSLSLMALTERLRKVARTNRLLGSARSAATTAICRLLASDRRGMAGYRHVVVTVSAHRRRCRSWMPADDLAAVWSPPPSVTRCIASSRRCHAPSATSLSTGRRCAAAGRSECRPAGRRAPTCASRSAAGWATARASPSACRSG